MKSCFVYLFIILFSLEVFCQENVSGDVKYYKINNIEYVLFSKYSGLILNGTYPEYTKFASIDNVLKVDSSAFEFVKKQKHMPSQGFGGCPIIKDNWANYGRQVACYLEKKGRKKYEEIIQINYIHNSEIAQFEKEYELYGIEFNWKKEWLYMLDGCSFYFQVYYNVNKGKVVEFSVNGIGG